MSHVATIFGQREVKDELGLETQSLPTTRLNLDPDEHVIFIYDGAPAHRNPVNPGPNTELKKLPPYSPFLNIVEQAIRALKAAIKADISRPQIQEEMNNRAEAKDKASHCTAWETHAHPIAITSA
ncbi:hypothetical protein AC249_AIPGENE19429 [Exaiptasia diaphana]|nr:hypothetical protein AC249_AIPGENE19429 [Exaiptasia diaphana]